jgi:hypothetical protein
MPKYIVKYTRESWREVVVEGEDEQDAYENFAIHNKNVDWSTDKEYDEYVDYDNADVYQYEGE